MKNFVIFGASGDLAKNHLFPALINLNKAGHQFNYYGFGRSQLDQSVVNSFGLNKFTYIQGQYDLSGLSKLNFLTSSETIYYFAIPIDIDLIKNIINTLNSLHLVSPKSKLVIEKPFGSDYSTAKQLMNYFEENHLSQSIYLVDHYLTKNLVKNIISLRFANPIFNYLWNKKYIKEINITATETQGINNRGGYYDQTGAIKDMVQNHLLQLLTLITMDSPASFNHSDFVSKKIDILKSVKIIPSSLRLGQYQGYTQEKDVGPRSVTETFVKLKLKLDHPNWRGVPINIVTGKKLDQKITEINIVFNPFVDCLWGEDCHRLIPNQLTITLQPKNDIILTINSSFNPHQTLPKPISLSLGSLDITTSAYENVILDVINNIKLNTPSFDEILLQWQIIDKIFSLPNLKKSLFYY